MGPLSWAAWQGPATMPRHKAAVPSAATSLTANTMLELICAVAPDLAIAGWAAAAISRMGRAAEGAQGARARSSGAGGRGADAGPAEAHRSPPATPASLLASPLRSTMGVGVRS